MDLNGKVYKPAVPGSTMPVLNTGRNIDNISCVKLLCRLSPFLIIASTARHKQNLAARVFVPAVAASRLKGHVPDGKGRAEIPDLPQARG